MPIPKKTAKLLIDRFMAAALRDPPDSTEILVGTMAARAKSDKHGAAMADAWIGRSEYWPKPANLVQLAAEIETPDNIAARA